VAFDERIHQARPHPGQLRTAANLRKMLEGSSLAIRIATATACRMLTLCVACHKSTAQFATTLAHCREVMEIEVNSR